jgi:Serine/threonine protein kinase
MTSSTPYDLKERIGRGSYGSIWKARINGIERAVKVVQCSDISRFVELDIMRRLKHENIIELLEFRLTNTHLYLVMELANINLEQYILDNEGLSFGVKLDFICQLAKAVDYLHHNLIFHGDLKPSNVLIVDRRVVITDFGLSYHFDQINNDAIRCCQTIYYSSPEIASKFLDVESEIPRECQSFFNQRIIISKSEIWSLGLIFAFILCGDHLLRWYDGHNHKDEIVELVSNTTAYLNRGGVPEEFLSLLSKMLNPIAEKRIGTKEIMSALGLTNNYELKQETTAKVSFSFGAETKYLVELLNNYESHANVGFFAFDLLYRLHGSFETDVLTSFVVLLLADSILYENKVNLLSTNKYVEKLGLRNILSRMKDIIEHLDGYIYRPNIYTYASYYETLKDSIQLLLNYDNYISTDIRSYVLMKESFNKRRRNKNIKFKELLH